MSDRQFVIACVIDSHPRFWVELILWIHCVRRWLPQEQFKPKVYFVGTVPEDLQQWVKALGVDTAQSACQVEGSPHCNKIAPFLDEHDADWIVVTDADLFIVDDLSHFFRHRRLRAAPNNHCNPPAHVFKSVLAASGINKPYRPGTTLYKGGGDLRESGINNISAGIVGIPKVMAKSFAAQWIHWARWLVANRSVLGRWSVHVDQMAFALAAEDVGEDVEFLPAQANMILHSLTELCSPYAFHLTTGHIPLFPDRFGQDKMLQVHGLTDDMRERIGRLNSCIEETVSVIKQLSSIRDHADKFLNPLWKR